MERKQSRKWQNNFLRTEENESPDLNCPLNAQHSKLKHKTKQTKTKTTSRLIIMQFQNKDPGKFEEWLGTFQQQWKLEQNGVLSLNC